MTLIAEEAKDTSNLDYYTSYAMEVPRPFVDLLGGSPLVHSRSQIFTDLRLDFHHWGGLEDSGDHFLSYLSRRMARPAGPPHHFLSAHLLSSLHHEVHPHGADSLSHLQGDSGGS